MDPEELTVKSPRRVSSRHPCLCSRSAFINDNEQKCTLHSAKLAFRYTKMDAISVINSIKLATVAVTYDSS